MCEDVDLFPAGQIQFGARREKVKTGLRQLSAVFAGKHGIERGLQGMQMGDIGGGVSELLFRELRRPPIGTLLFLRQFDVQEFAHQVFEAVPVSGLTPSIAGGGSVGLAL